MTSRYLLRSVAIAFGLLTIGLASRIGAQSAALGYVLESTHPITATQPTRMGQAVAVRVSYDAGELLVVDQRPPRVLVFEPDGALLRIFGQGSLVHPVDVGVIYERKQGLFAYGDPERVRYIVREENPNRLLMFSADGNLIQQTALIDGKVLLESDSQRLYLASVANRELTIMDYAGQITGGFPITLMSDSTLMTLGPSVTPIGGPPTLLLYNNDSRVLDQISLDTGDIVRSRTLDIGERVEELTWSQQGTNGVLLRLNSGSISWLADDTVAQPAPVATILDTSDGDAPRLLAGTHWFAVTHTSSGVSGIRPFSPIYGISSTGSLGRWYIRQEFNDVSLEPLCNMAASESTAVRDWLWRVGVIHGQPVVLSEQGALSVLAAGDRWEPLGSIGPSDDFDIDAEGQLYRLRDGRMAIYHRQDGGWRTVVPSKGAVGINQGWWHTEWDCTPPGTTWPGSIAVDSKGIMVDWLVNGWLDVAAGLDWDASSMHHRRVRSGTDEDPRFGAWDSPLSSLGYGRSWGEHPQERLIADFDFSAVPGEVWALDRLAAQVLRAKPGIQDPNRVRNGTRIPGRPARLSVSEQSSLTFVLTAEGSVYVVDDQGSVRGGWSTPMSREATKLGFADIVSLPEGRVGVLDGIARRLYIYRPAFVGERVAEPDALPYCTVEEAKVADREQVPIGNEVGIQLELRGGCGRIASDNDVVILMDQPLSSEQRAMVSALQALVDSLDPQLDRLAILLYTYPGRVALDFTNDFSRFAPVVANLPPGKAGPSSPLRFAATYLEREGRPDANRVLIAHSIYTRGLYPYQDGGLRAVNGLREAGIRVYSITAGPFILPQLWPTFPEDHFLVPDADTLRSVYQQLGKEFAARVLARQLTVRDRVPDNMDLVVNSISPPASWDVGTRTLVWQANDVGFSGWQASYRLVPREMGQHATNESASAELIDGFGNPFQVTFPIPMIDVLAPATASPTSVVTASPTVTPVVSPAVTIPVSPTRIFLPVLLREPPCEPDARPVDAILVIDASSSMTGPKLAAARTAARAFLEALSLGADRLAVVSFHQEAIVQSGLTSSRATLDMAIASIRTSPGTRMDSGLGAAHDLLTTTGRPDAASLVILLTDGRQDEHPEAAMDEADFLRNSGVRLESVGYGGDADLAFLTVLTGDPRRVHRADDETALVALYRQLAAASDCPQSPGWSGR